jgi:heme/copper-type cytochrome/quinol oxidase subunit 2
VSNRKTQKLRLLAVVLVIISVTTAFLVSAYTFHLFNLGGCGTPSNAPASTKFTIIMSRFGYNDSKDHVLPWPIMNVTLKQMVGIHLSNNDTQAHGFAIDHYFIQGALVPPGQTYEVSFDACQSGTFKIYNTVFDTTDAFEHAQLNVN